MLQSIDPSAPPLRDYLVFHYVVTTIVDMMIVLTFLAITSIVRAAIRKKRSRAR
jgi:hypothetical protein